MYMKTHKLFTL